jgi:hypothetical protein
MAFGGGLPLQRPLFCPFAAGAEWGDPRNRPPSIISQPTSLLLKRGVTRMIAFHVHSVIRERLNSAFLSILSLEVVGRALWRAFDHGTASPKLRRRNKHG